MMQWKRHICVPCLLCVAALPACAQRPVVPTDEVKEATQMNQPSTNAATQITAEELFSRLFKLAAALREPADLELDRVQEEMGLDFEPKSSDSETYISKGILAEGWKYGMSFSRQQDGFPDVRLHFADQGMHQGRCAADLERLTEGLVHSGYQRYGPTYPPGRRSWGLVKDVVETSTGFEVRAFTKFDRDHVDVRRECVIFLKIGYRALNDV